MASEIITLGAEGLSALVDTYPVDGRVSWHAPGVRGVAPANCYLLTEGDHALLIDTGLTVHEQPLLEQLRTAVPAGSQLSVLLLRQGEFDSMCNLPSIVRAFDVRTIYGQYVDAPVWADLHADDDKRMVGEWAEGARLSTVVLPSDGTLDFGPGGRRPLDVFVPALRLLGTYWVFDRASGTLFTSDSFTYVVRDDASGPWVVTEDDDTTTADEIEEHLRTTRYWWLPGAHVDELRASMARVFERHAVRRIAPAFGCVLEGEAVVERHYAMLDGVVAKLGFGSPSSVAQPPRTSASAT